MQTGTYILLLHLPVDAELDIPDLDSTLFPAGFYAYAAGAENLPERLKAHLTPPEQPAEHIDFLRRAASVSEIWLTMSATPHPHVWVDLLLAIPGAISIADGFGVSGCDCDSHLVYFDVRPQLDDFQIGARKLFPDEVIVIAKTDA